MLRRGWVVAAALCAGVAALAFGVVGFGERLQPGLDEASGGALSRAEQWLSEWWPSEQWFSERDGELGPSSAQAPPAPAVSAAGDAAPVESDDLQLADSTELQLRPLTPGDAPGVGRLLSAVYAQRRVVVLADTDDSSLRLFDAEDLSPLRRIALSCAPAQLLIDADDVLALSTACNQLQRLRLSQQGARVVAAVELASEPVSMAVAGDELVVVSDWGATLSRVRRDTLELRSRLELGRSPRAVAVSRDARTAYVTHAAGDALSVVDLRSSEVTQQHLGAMRARVSVRHVHPRRMKHPAFELDFGMGLEAPIPHRAHLRRSVQSIRMFATQAFALALGDDPLGDEKVFVPQVLASPDGGGSVATGYGTSIDNFPPTIQDVAVYDAKAGTSNRGGKTFAIIDGWKASDKNVCRLPRDAVCNAARGSLLVACAGSGRVLEYDAWARDPARTEWMAWRVPAGPTALHLEQSRRSLLVWSEFERSLSRLELPAAPAPRRSEHSPEALQARQAETPAGPLLASVPVELSASEAEKLAALAGRALFHRALDAAISKDGRACASCHPSGRDDGLSWRTPGQLATRQTMMLAGRVQDTAPYGWRGEHATLSEHVTHTIEQQLHGTGLSDAELATLVNYLEHLPGPQRASAANSDEVARGEALFYDAEVGCADCHDAEGTVDGDQHELEGQVTRDTPSLRYIAGTAPFFHDGSYASLDDMLVHSQGSMGQQQPLDAPDRQALVAYLRTL